MTYEALTPYLFGIAANDCQVPRADGPAATDGAPAAPPRAYTSPAVVDLGHVRDVTLGSSPSGNADANAQYYW
ncbi:lasso RiPP family leader peptide-containing protein [Streptomyces sp. NPDC014846]|uniref:lasso RiPP family leader peptide-containing protein n=1 Tax=unclassified Streptomyces TaxID=2593676 RepID=UPI0036F51A97